MFHVYCITDNRFYCDGNGIPKVAYKIGKAEDPVGRTRDLRKQETFLDERFRCEFVIKSEVTELEPMFHKQFSKYRVSHLREWFIAPLESIIEYANELCKENGNVLLDYGDLCVSDTSAENMVKLIKDKLANKHIIVSTNKPFKTNTRGYIQKRVEKIREIIANYKSQRHRNICVEEFLSMKVTCQNEKGDETIYKKQDFFYDIKGLYFKIVEETCVQTPPRTLTSPTKKQKPRRFFVCSFDEEETKDELYAWETKEDDDNDGFKGQ